MTFSFKVTWQGKPVSFVEEGEEADDDWITTADDTGILCLEPQSTISDLKVCKYVCVFVYVSNQVYPLISHLKIHQFISLC